MNDRAMDDDAELAADYRSLVEQHGRARWSATPLVEPTQECFPERWEADAPSVAALAENVFGRAGLAHMELEIQAHRRQIIAPAREDHAIHRSVVETREPFGPARVLACTATMCVLGVDLEALAEPAERLDPGMLVASLCGAAAFVLRAPSASAYRDAPGSLSATEADLRVVDVATIVLGFGVLTTNDAYRFLPPTRKPDGVSRFAAWHRSAGSLSHESMARLLALDVHARDPGRAAEKRVHAHLHPNQREVFSEALSAIRSR